MPHAPERSVVVASIAPSTRESDPNRDNYKRRLSEFREAIHSQEQEPTELPHRHSGSVRTWTRTSRLPFISWPARYINQGSPFMALLSGISIWHHTVHSVSLSPTSKRFPEYHPSPFCDQHCTDCREDKEAWLLQRDITYALIVPVLEIYRHAAQVARALLGNRHIFDLELVFRGEARGTFSWLQCFITEEEDWCLTKGCPGCVVSYPLQAEPTIRMILVACRLSSSLRQQCNISHLPMFDFWSDVMKKALDEDPFWGPSLWKDFEARAAALEKGIEELVSQCIELAPVAASAAQADDSPPTSPKHVFPKAPRPIAQERLHWVPSIVSGCWTTLLADAAEAKRIELSPDDSPSPPPLLSRWLTG
ncbi:MAG: hypothetical protein Q9188_002754 [Gyalolechia gomerana]